MIIRDGRDDDGPALITLISDCWAEYPGCVMDVDGENPHYRAMRSHAADLDGRFWVIDGDNGMAGCVVVVPGRGFMELRTLYVAKTNRRRGLASRLVAMVEGEARNRAYQSVELWSDTRFTDGHALYRRLGYRQTPETRDLNDLSHTVEYRFLKTFS